MKKIIKNVYSPYTPHLDQIANELATQGKTNAEIASALKISEATLYLWRNKHESFRDALQAGKDQYDSENVEKAMLEDALGKEFEEVTFERGEDGGMVETKRQKKWQRNFQAQRMWLMNRHRDRWKDQHEIVISDKDLETKLQEAEKRLKELRNGKGSETRDLRCDEVAQSVGPEGGQSILPGTAGE